MDKIVRVFVSGGVVKHVEVPAGVIVFVNDYDVEGCCDDLQRDGNGDEYAEAIWEPEEKENP